MQGSPNQQPNPQSSPLISLRSDMAVIKSSFFDDLSFNVSSVQNSPTPMTFKRIWISPPDMPKVDLDQPLSQLVLIEGELQKIKRKGDKSKLRYFVLYEDRLVYYKDSKKTVAKGIVLMKGAKVDCIEQVPKDEANSGSNQSSPKQSNFQTSPKQSPFSQQRRDQSTNSTAMEEENFQDKYCFFFTQNKKFEILFATSKESFLNWQDHFKRTCILSYFGKYYNSVKVIGKGTFAKVVLSKRIVDNAQFAVKTFDKKSLMKSDHANRSKVGLVNEINIMRILDHPNIIKLYEVYEGQFHIYLVMDLLKGGELFDRIIRDGHFAEEKAYKLIRQLLDALEYLHAKGLMHRDIKPENLILRDEHSLDVRLADFGLSESFEKKTRIFSRCGTPGYVAPEILTDKPYGPKVDVFSAGVILYILLTGCSVFNGNSYDEIISKNKRCEINWHFEKINIHLSELCLDILHKMLEKEPENRPSIHEILQHPWIKQYETGISSQFQISQELSEQNAKSAQENMMKFQQERFNVSTLKPKDVVMCSPLMNGRTETVDSKFLDSPIMSASEQRNEQKKISELHKKVLMRNMQGANSVMNKYLPQKKAVGEVDHIIEEEGQQNQQEAKRNTPDSQRMVGRGGDVKNVMGNLRFMESPGVPKTNVNKSPEDNKAGLDNKSKDIKNALKKMEIK